VLFNTLQFAVFFFVVLGLYRALPRPGRNTLLLGASIVFYTLWLPSYLLLLLADVFVNYALLRAMVRSNRPRIYLVLSCVFTLGLLAWFKYAAMLIETALPVLEQLPVLDIAVPEIFLPLGISFYSFQILSLTIDTYRRQIEPIEDLGRYTLFVAFFPQLIAGPILRGHQFLPQLERGGEMSWARSRRGLWLIVGGLGKKVILADFLLAGFVDMVFAEHGANSAPFHLIALYSFAFQIYFDFSGYTDIARGLALLLGYELPLNFMEPYLARSPSEFWRRWHITLSRWLSDYLYVPLGGNRRGSARTYSNLLLTMLLGGLWHGASWNFVIWGGLHGLLLVLHRAIGRQRVDLDAPLRARDWPRIVILFHAVCLIWTFFRAETFADAISFLEVLFSGKNPFGWPMIQVAIVILCAALHLAERHLRLALPDLRSRLDNLRAGPVLEGAMLGAVLGGVLLAGGTGGDFIYFQF
jgi:D-alanyl-lipoteichoic acid acyltransferase DltB (MBOAT superfamily)